MIRWIDTLSAWDRTLPAVLVTPDPGPDEGPDLFKAFVTRALDRHEELIAVEHRRDRAPLILQPVGSGLFASRAKGSGLLAFALARTAVGVGIGAEEARPAVPWLALHPLESGMLRRRQGRERAAAFARLLSVKEAYGQALGPMASREPSSFAARFLDEERAVVEDRAGTGEEPAEARTTWRIAGGIWIAISAVLLGRRVLHPRP